MNDDHQLLQYPLVSPKKRDERPPYYAPRSSILRLDSFLRTLPPPSTCIIAHTPAPRSNKHINVFVFYFL